MFSGRLRRWWAWALAVVALCAVLPAAAGTAGATGATGEPAPDPAGRAAAGPGVVGRYHPATPILLRSPQGVGAPARMAAGVGETVQVTGRHGIPSTGVGAVTLLVTVSGAGRSGAVALAAPQQLSGASPTATFEHDERSTQQVLVPLDASGALVLVASSAVTVQLHVVGWVGLTTSAPDIVVLGQGVVVLDGAGRTSRLTRTRDRVARVGARAGVPRGVDYAVAQLTLINGGRDTALEARAVGSAPRDRPMVSAARRSRTSQQVLLPLDSRGRAVLDLGRGSAHVRLVVVGYLTGPVESAASGEVGLESTDRLRRLLDTARGGVPTGSETLLRVAGRRGVPASASSVAATVTLVGPRRRAGSVQLGPYGVQHGSSMPPLEVGPGELRSVHVTLPVGASRSWAVTRSRGVRVVVDVAGWSTDRALTVRPPNLSRLTPLTPGPRSDDAALARHVLATSTSYTMGPWFDDVLPGLLRVHLTKGPPVLLSRSARSIKTDEEADPGRRIANAVLGVAATSAARAWDADLIGVDEAAGVDRAVRLLQHLADGHQSVEVGGWGGGWQGSLIGGPLGRAAWLLWDDLPGSLRADVARIIEKEAVEAAGEPMVHLRGADGVATGVVGDSRAEEVSWQALSGQLALAMLPGSDHRSTWSYSVIQAALTSWARPADVSDSSVVHGLPLSSWLSGSNVEDDGTVVNHDRVAPEYMALMAQTMDQVWIQALVGEPAPRATTLLLAPVYDALLRRTFDPADHAAPGGTIYPPGEARVYYPEGTDWGTGIQLRFALLDAQAQAYGLADEDIAGDYLRLHLEAAAAMQDRFADGRTYGDWSEFTYVGREEMLAQEAAGLVLTLGVRDAGTASFSDRAFATY